jgi:hypothetical protein
MNGGNTTSLSVNTTRTPDSAATRKLAIGMSAIATLASRNPLHAFIGRVSFYSHALTDAEALALGGITKNNLLAPASPMSAVPTFMKRYANRRRK